MASAVTLRERLDRCAGAASLSTADLAVWFELSYQTIRSWRRGAHPQATRRRQIEQRLLWLEQAIDGDVRLPVPLRVRSFERAQYVSAIRENYDRGR